MTQPHHTDPSASEGDDSSTSHAAGHAGSDQGLRVLSYLIAGMLFYGALGWLGDRAFDTNFLMPIGIILGMALAIFMIIRRFGRVEESSDSPGSTNQGRQGQ